MRKSIVVGFCVRQFFASELPLAAKCDTCQAHDSEVEMGIFCSIASGKSRYLFYFFLFVFEKRLTGKG